MRLAVLVILLFAGCAQPEPEFDCVTHSPEAGGLVECSPRDG